MSLPQILLISLVALIHIYIVILEMLLWTKPKGMKAFGIKSKELAEETKVMAANQGLYNGFLAAGLIWSIFKENTEFALFFLGCVFIAGLYGAYSTKQIKILYIQTIPEALAVLSIVYF